MSRPLRGLAPLVAAALLLTGCGGPDETSRDLPAPPPSATATAPEVASYVALGDSYTSAPYVRLTDVAGGCLRSDHNYPSLLADRLGLTGGDFTDVSCAGATTEDLTEPQQTFAGEEAPAQLDAVRPGTALVTLGLGGNDFGLFGDIAGSCVFPRGGRTDCGDVDVDRAEQVLPRIGTRLTRALRAVTRKAPDATVVLVGYPRIVDASRACPDVLPLDAGSRSDLQRVNSGLNDAMSAAARRAGAEFVDVYAAGEGHDVCAGADAWVNGIRTDTARAAALHPFAAEQTYVASQLLRLVTGR